MLSIQRFPYREIVAETRRIATERLRQSLPALTALTAIDDESLDAWQSQWLPVMPPDQEWSDWDWAKEMLRWSGKRNRFDMAIWSDDHLCGLMIGRSSPRRHNFSVCVMQGSPVDAHPLKRQILPVVVEVGAMYGTALGCRELRFLKPLQSMIPLYEQWDFRLARTSRGVQYCARSL